MRTLGMPHRLSSIDDRSTGGREREIEAVQKRAFACHTDQALE